MTEEQNYTVEADVDASDRAVDDAVDADGRLAGPAVEDAAIEEARPRRPVGVPEKFWDAQAGTLRSEALLKSYVELERKLSSMIPLPSDEQDLEGHERLRRVLGVPDTADGYLIEAPDGALRADPEVNGRLHEAGFTQRQAQLVYDLASEHVMPLINEAVAELEATRDAERWRYTSVARIPGGPSPGRSGPGVRPICRRMSWRCCPPATMASSPCTR